MKIQWNLNGYYAHLGKLQNLISQTSPKCLQETRLHNHEKLALNDYTTFRKDHYNPNNAGGGIAILVHDTCHATELHLYTNLEAVAITTYIPKKITLCSIYLPPNQKIETHQLKNLIR